jgi:hypothetical protein
LPSQLKKRKDEVLKKPFHESFPVVIKEHLTKESIKIGKMLGVYTKYPADDCGGVKNGAESVHAWDAAFHRMKLPLVLNDENCWFPDTSGVPFHEALLKIIPGISNVNEMKFLASVIAACEVPAGREEILRVWDVMLERFSFDWQNIDFDIAEHIGLPRQAKAA